MMATGRSRAAASDGADGECEVISIIRPICTAYGDVDGARGAVCISDLPDRGIKCARSRTV